MAALERGAGGVNALERPGVAVAPAEFAAERRHAVRLRLDRLEELVEPRDPHLGVGLERRDQIAYASDRRRRRVMIRPDGHRQMRAGRAAHQHGLEAAPGLA